MTGEECFKISMRIKDISLVEAEKYFKQGAYDFNHFKCMLKLAEITQDEGEKNTYYELAAEFGEIDAVNWVIENLIAKKNYEEARTKFESYKEHLSPDRKIELQDKITFETLKDKSDKGTISTEEMRVLLELIDKIPNESERLKKYEKLLSSLYKVKAPNSQSEQVASRISTLKQKMEFKNLRKH